MLKVLVGKTARGEELRWVNGDSHRLFPYGSSGGGEGAGGEIGRGKRGPSLAKATGGHMKILF